MVDGEGADVFQIESVEERGVLLTSGWFEPSHKCNYVPDAYIEAGEADWRYFEDRLDHPEWTIRNPVPTLEDQAQRLEISDVEETLKQYQDEVDDLVCDVFAEQASRINNGGIHEQLPVLLEYFTLEEIIEEVKRCKEG